MVSNKCPVIGKQIVVSLSGITCSNKIQVLAKLKKKSWDFSVCCLVPLDHSHDLNNSFAGNWPVKLKTRKSS